MSTLWYPHPHGVILSVEYIGALITFNRVLVYIEYS